MVRKKEIVNIFKEYEKVLLEQVVGDKVSSLLNRVKSSSLDSNTKNELIEILNNNSNTPEQEIPEQGFPKQGLKMKNPFFKGDAGPQGRNYQNQRDAVSNKRRDNFDFAERSQYQAPRNLKNYQNQRDEVSDRKREDFGNMMSDPSKRPSVQSNKADALENEYLSKIDALQEKYKNSQKITYDDILEDCYMETKGEMESAFYTLLDKMRNADRRQWDKMARGDTSGGLYNDLETTGSDASHGENWSFESNAKSNMRNMLDLENTYLSGNKRRLIYLLTNCLRSKGYDANASSDESDL